MKKNHHNTEMNLLWWFSLCLDRGGGLGGISAPVSDSAIELRVNPLMTRVV